MNRTAPHIPPGMEYPPENPWVATRNRILQELAQVLPGAMTLRPRLHRARGVNIGENVWIGYDVVLETAYPSWITIEDGAAIGIRVIVIAHFREMKGVTIGRDVFVGPGVIVLPGVEIGHGAVVTAGSVVTKSIPPLTVAQGNPAVPTAKVTRAFTKEMSVKRFSRSLRPLDSGGASRAAGPGPGAVPGPGPSPGAGAVRERD